MTVEKTDEVLLQETAGMPPAKSDAMVCKLADSSFFRTAANQLPQPWFVEFHALFSSLFSTDVIISYHPIPLLVAVDI